jgi:ribonuclease R
METSKELADQILRLVHAPEYRPVKPRQIATLINAPDDQYREVRRTIKGLVLEGQLIYGGNHLVLSPNAASGYTGIVRGTFRRAIGGFGFVRPNSGHTESEAPDDIFIPPGKTLGALNDDLVEVRLLSKAESRRNGEEGTIEKILERRRRQFTGTFQSRGGGGGVAFLDGTPFEEAVSVGDIRGLPVEDDDKIVVEMVEFPDALGMGGEAVILEVLGSSKNPAIDTLTIMRQFGLPDEFPDEVIASARKQADKFDETDLSNRRDLTDLLTITIDPYDARDFDDAISLQHQQGRWTLWVHIADVTHFVPEGSPLDHDANDRATSVYLPDRVIPMLPEIISNHLASLQPERVRFAKTVEIEFLDNGTVTSTEVYNSAIRSDKRFDYDQVDRFLTNRDLFTETWGEEICGLLGRMHQLAMTLRRRRIDHGSITMDMPEIKLDLDKLGKVKGAFLVANTESHQIIEEFMLAANQAVATWLEDLHLRFLRRIHPPPDRRKLRQLSRFVADLGLKVGELESRFEIQAVLDSVAGTALENAVNFAVLKSMNKAIYAPHDDGHYALDMQNYCHFTSPIRRYPDLTVHRLVQKVIDGLETPDQPLPVLVQLGHHCSDKERNAEQAERELILLKLLHHLKKHVGETMEAVISRVFPDGFHARCVKLPVEGFVDIKSLPGDKYRYERRGQMIVGFKAGNQFRLGDRLTVRIAKVDLRERQLFLDVVKTHKPKPVEKAKSGLAKPGKAKKKPSKCKTPARQKKMSRRKKR